MTQYKFKQIALFLITMFLVINSTAQPNTEPSRDSLTDNQRLTISRKLFWDHLPKPSRWINDYEGMFTDAEKDSLNTIISRFEKETGFEIAIITLDTICVSRNNFDELILHFANTWGVGKKETNNGITIGISRGYKKWFRNREDTFR